MYENDGNQQIKKKSKFWNFHFDEHDHPNDSQELTRICYRPSDQKHKFNFIMFPNCKL